MSHAGRIAYTLTAAVVIIATCGVTIDAQNHAPNPYQAVEGWADPGRAWGSMSAVYPARDGSGNIWVSERCGANSCTEAPDVDSVLLFDPSGKLVKSFGAGLIMMPHGMFVDADNNVWVTDTGRANGKGYQVHKFSPDGDVLMTLGTPGGTRRRQPYRQVLERRDVHQDMGQNRNDQRGFQRPPRLDDGFPGTAVRRRPVQQPGPDFRPGRRLHRDLDAVRSTERTVHRWQRHPVFGRLGVEHTAKPGLETGYPIWKCQRRLGNELHSGSGTQSGQICNERFGRRCSGRHGEHIRCGSRAAGSEEIRQAVAEGPVSWRCGSAKRQCHQERCSESDRAVDIPRECSYPRRP